jgi:prepilin-type N-terminal cleavage/methylation domain-containing protein
MRVPTLSRSAVRTGGFSLLEVMIVASLLGVLAMVGISYTVDASKREQSLAVSVEFSGWLEGIQRRAMGVPGGCRVKILAGRNNGGNATNPNVNLGSLFSPGDTLAQTWPNAESSPNLSSNACSVNASFLIPAAGFRTSSGPIFRVAANRPKYNDGFVDFSFTPRGGIDSTDTILLRVQRAPLESTTQAAVQRRGTYDSCVRIDRTSGMIGIGHGECNANEFDDQI